MTNTLARTLSRTLVAATLAATALSSAHAQTAPVPVQDFSVFVDIATGFAFVKTPSGWRFVRQIEAEKLTQLHPSTLVALGEVRVPAGVPLGQTDLVLMRASLKEQGSLF